MWKTVGMSTELAIVGTENLGKATVCCTPFDRTPIGVAQAEGLSRTFRALGDPARIRLISLVAANAASEACVCDLTEPLGLSQGTVSHHLKVLVDAGIFTREKRSTWAYYRLVPGALDSIARSLISA